MKNHPFIAIFLMLLLSCNNDLTECPDYDCLNGSVCFNGTCACPEGFTGLSCDQEILPPFELTKVKVMRFPALKIGGEEWDGPFSNQPDIYIRVSLDNQAIYSFPDDFQEADYTQVYTFDIQSLTTLTLLPNKNYQLELLDRDGDADDLMGSVLFHFTGFSNDNQGSPQIISLTGSKVDFELTVQ